MRPSRSEAGRAACARGGLCLGTALLVVLLAAGPARGQSGGGPAVSSSHECCAELLFPLGARQVALAGAVVADSAADMVLSNPAGIAGLHDSELLVHYRQMVADGRVLALSFVRRPFRFGTFALSYTLTDAGSLDITDAQGNLLGETYLQGHTLAGSFATTFATGIAAGLTYKVFIRRAPNTNQGDTGGGGGATQLLDLGLQYRPRWSRWLALGAAVTNTGLPLQIVNYEQADRTPVRGHLGATYEVLHLFHADSTLTGSLSGQVDVGDPNGTIPAVAAEVTVGDVVSVRAGWRGGDPLKAGTGTGTALGVGLKLERYQVAVAKSLTSSPLETDPEFLVTFGMSF
jgi:hypothetical protein